MNPYRLTWLIVDPISLVFVSTLATCVATTKSVENLLQVLLMKFKLTRDKRYAPEMWARPCQGMTVTGVSSVEVRPSQDVGTGLTRLMVVATVSVSMAPKSARLHVVNLNI